MSGNSADDMKSLSLAPGPVVTKHMFSQISGLGEETIRGMVNKGYLPTVKIGKHRMVNLALLTKDVLDSEY